MCQANAGSHVERLIREAVAAGASGTLLQAWDSAVAGAAVDDAWRREMTAVRDALARDFDGDQLAADDVDAVTTIVEHFIERRDAHEAAR